MDDKEFAIKIRIDADTTGAKQAATSLDEVKKTTEKSAEASTEAGKAAEKHTSGLHALHKLFHALNEVVPGLGVVMQAAFSPIGATISLAVIALRLFHDKMKEVNEDFRKMEEEAAKPATRRMEAWREATVRAAEGMNHLRQSLGEAARAEQTVKEMTERTTAAFRERIQATATLAEAVKENELAGLEETHEAGLVSEEQYAVQRLEIEQRYQDKKREIQEREEMTEILIRRRALEAAEIAQPGLTSTAETAELKKVKALEDLGSLDKSGVEERKKETATKLKAFEDKYTQWSRWFEDFGVSANPVDVSAKLGTRENLSAFQASGGFRGMVGGPGLSEAYTEWVRLKTGADAANAEWKQFPKAEAQRKVASDMASDEAARAEKAAVDNQRFITETGRDIGDRRTRFDEHHRDNQEIGALQQNTAMHQAIAKARADVKRDERAILEAMEHSTGFSAEALKKIQEHGKTLADLEQRMRSQEGRVPRL